MENIKLDELPRDPLLVVAMNMDFSTLNNFCKSSEKINEKICNNDNFWRNKLAQDFPGFIKHLRMASSCAVNQSGLKLYFNNRKGYMFFVSQQ